MPDPSPVRLKAGLLISITLPRLGPLRLQLHIAQLLADQGKLEQASQMLQAVLEEYKGCWGDNHPETAYVIIRLADVELAILRKRVGYAHACAHACRGGWQVQPKYTCLGSGHVWYVLFLCLVRAF